MRPGDRLGDHDGFSVQAVSPWLEHQGAGSQTPTPGGPVHAAGPNTPNSASTPPGTLVRLAGIDRGAAEVATLGVRVAVATGTWDTPPQPGPPLRLTFRDLLQFRPCQARNQGHGCDLRSIWLRRPAWARVPHPNESPERERGVITKPSKGIDPRPPRSSSWRAGQMTSSTSRASRGAAGGAAALPISVLSAARR